MIPVIGFLANGVEFMVAQSEVEDAFRSAHQAAEVADASREFKMALAAMRMSAKEFAARPSYDLVDAFGDAHDNAVRVPRDDGERQRASAQERAEIAAMQTKVAALKDNFSGLIREQEGWAFRRTKDCIRSSPQPAARVERIIIDEMPGLPKTDSQQLLISLRDHASLRERSIRNTARRKFPPALRGRDSSTSTRILTPSTSLADDQGAARSAGQDLCRHVLAMGAGGVARAALGR